MKAYQYLLNIENVKEVFNTHNVSNLENDLADWLEQQYNDARFDSNTFQKFEDMMLQYYGDKLSTYCYFNPEIIFEDEDNNDWFRDSVYDDYGTKWTSYVYEVLALLEASNLCYPLEMANVFIKFLLNYNR